MRTGRVRRRAIAAVLATTVLGLTVAFGVLAPSAAADPTPDRYCARADAHSSADSKNSDATKVARRDDDWWVHHGRHSGSDGRWLWYGICEGIGPGPGAPVLAPPSSSPTQSAPVRVPGAPGSSASKSAAAQTPSTTTRSTAAAARHVAAPSTPLPQVPATQDAPRAATQPPPKPTTAPAAETATQPVGQPLVRGDTLVAVLGGVLAGFVAAVAAIVFLGGRRRARD